MTQEEKDKCYIGERKDGMKHGKGRLFDQSGNLVYDGQWLENKKSGIGELYVNVPLNIPYDYKGEFKDDKRHGQGQEFFPNGELHYSGSWKRGKYDGNGQIYTQEETKDGIIHALAYDGGFKCGLRHGKGTAYDEHKDISYKGQWKKGLYDGQGKYYLKSILMYNGSYKAGRRHGKGAEYYLNGVVKYAGDFKDNLYDGCGLLYYECDDLQQILHYEGQWMGGLAHGKGKYYKRNHLDYDGEWFADKRTGEGTMYDEEGVVYSGFWLNDMPDETMKRKKNIENEVVEAKAYIPSKKRKNTN